MKDEIWVRHTAHHPSRFKDYALKTISGECKKLVELDFKFDKSETEIWNSLSQEEKNKVKFNFINDKIQNH